MNYWRKIKITPVELNRDPAGFLILPKNAKRNRLAFSKTPPTLPTLTPPNSPTAQHTFPPSFIPSPSSWPFISTPTSSIPPFRSAAGLLLTLSPVGASKLTRSLTQLTSQTLSSGSTVAGLASCLRRVALFHCHRRHLCSSVASSVPASVASSVHASVTSSVLLDLHYLYSLCVGAYWCYLDLPPIVHGPEQQYCFLLAPPMGEFGWLG
ncbi:uncharacterized protein LOC107610539 [Arachis ipaensis]|uniref:uncharacterized protein LOC107610539 n=1 Tax=Arachis ipaensis TaxID=130454 RepID=UPI0007AF33D6|nr:uncharacterized protein LOC107610539 [Arachis ipaensis]